MTKRPKGTVAGLDALRSLAVLLVIGGHVAGDFVTAAGPTRFSKFPLFYFGWTGVDLFFVLSGFLIGRQLWKELRDTNRIQVGRFLLRRGFRIWPLYFFVVAFYAVVLGRAQLGFAGLGPDLLFVSNYITGQVSGGWSLSTEEQFYLIVPFLILVTNKFVALEKQILLPILLLLLLPLVRAVSPENMVYTPIHTHCDGLAMGLIFAWASVVRPELLSPKPFASNSVGPSVAIGLGVVLRVAHKVFAFSSLALIFGGMTWWILRDLSPLRRIYGWHGFYVISRLSYGMYLNHFLIIPRLMPLIARPGAVGMLLAYGGCVLVSILVSVVTFILIESPFLVLREKYLRHA